MENHSAYPTINPSLKAAIHTLQAWKEYLLKKRGVLFGFALAGLLLGSTWWLIRPTQYLASTTFVVEGSESSFGFGELMDLAAMIGMAQSGGEGGLFQGDNIMELYKSRKLIAETLLDPLDPQDSSVLLIDRFIQTHGLEGRLLRKAPFKNLSYQTGFNFSGAGEEALHSLRMNRYRDSIIQVLVERINKKHLRIGKPDRKLDILKVDLISRDESFSKRFNEQLVDNVNRFYTETKTKKSAENVAILQHKTDSVRQLMNEAIFATVTVTDATPNLNPTRQVRRMVPVQQGQFEMEVNAAVLEELVKNLEMARLGLSKETPLIEIIDAPILPLKKNDEKMFLVPVMGGLLALLLGVVYLLMRRTVLLALRD